MRLLRRVFPVGLAAAVLVVACTAPETAPPEPQTWSLAAGPDLIIGTDERAEETFGRIGAVTRFADGEIVVSDAQAAEVRVFGPEGGYRRTLAQRGEGPGEIQLMGWIQVVADSFLVSDLRTGRVSVLGRDGGFHRALSPPTDLDHGLLELVRRLRDGRWVVAAVEPYQNPAVASMQRSTLTYGIWDESETSAMEVIASAAGEALVFLPESRTLSFARFHLSAIPVAVGNSIAVVEPDSARAWVKHGVNSALSRFPLPLPQRDLTEAVVAATLARDRERFRSEAGSRLRQDLEAFYAVEPRPRFIPPVSRAVADGDSMLWLEEYDPLDPETYRYWVVDLAGELLATLIAPGRLRIHEVGPDWVLGVGEDADGVQRVMRYRLERR